MIDLLSTANAHSTVPSLPSWSDWSIDFFILSILTLLAVVYYHGLKRLRSYTTLSKRIRLKYRSISYYLGLFILLIALISPIDSMSDVLAWVHMLQHTLILMVAAPLMVVGVPQLVGHKAMSRVSPPFKSILGLGNKSKPAVALGLYLFTLLVWHLPRFYETALKSEVIHDFQHITFFVTSFLFWKVLFDPYQSKSLGPIAIIYPFIASLHGIALGFFMSLSSRPWYPSYNETAIKYGVSALQDQQIAGLIMWMPAGLTYAVAVIFVTTRLFKKETRPVRGS